jgi:molybdopterin molybdotransferase
MPEFLTLQIPQKAYSLLLQHLPPVQSRVVLVDTKKSINRVTALPILSPEDTPSFHRSTVDGYAIQASDTFGSSETLPAFFKVIGEVPMGSMPGFQLHQGEAALIHTGGALPEGSNAVVMLENTQLMPPADLEVYRATAENENVVRKSEDLKTGDVVFPAGIKLGPAQIGGLLALGILQVSVVMPPQVAILSSGDEVVDPEEKPLPGQVRDINSYALASLVESWGGIPNIMGIIPDRPELLEKAVRKALAEAELVIITAGSSASTRDLTSEVINHCGKPGVLVHGINIKPGKPTIMGVCDGKPVIGLPGNPVSAIVIARMFVTRLVARLSGITKDLPFAGNQAILTTNVPSLAGREDWVPVHLRQESDKLLADPIFFKSSLIFNLASADGLAYIPADVTGYGAGEQVFVIPLY